MKNPRAQFQNLIGVVGGAASGKDTVAEFFSVNGYDHVSSSDLLREEIARRGETTSRELQTKVANEMRATHGFGYWVDLSVLQLPETSTEAVISGLYSEGEGAHLINQYGGCIVGVVVGSADDSTARYERLRKRGGGDRDTLSYEEFMAAHARENGGSTPGETNISALLDLARFTIYNNADLAHLEDQTLQIINTLREER